MTRHDDFISQLEGYLDEYEGSTPLPDDVRHAIRARLPSTQQRPAWWPAWRFRPMNQTMRIALASAAVVAVALIGISLLGGQDVGGPGLGGPPSETPTPSPIPSLPDLADQSDALAPGSYVITDVPPFRITITVPEGWEKLAVPATVWAVPASRANLGFASVDNLYVDPCAPDLGLHEPPIGLTVDDLVTALAAMPGLEATSPTDVTVDGFAAKYVELSAPESREECNGVEGKLWDIPGEWMPAPGPGDHPLRLWMVDVDGDRLVISASDRVDTTPEELAEREAIFNSIQIDRP